MLHPWIDWEGMEDESSTSGMFPTPPDGFVDTKARHPTREEAEREQKRERRLGSANYDHTQLKHMRRGK